MKSARSNHVFAMTPSVAMPRSGFRRDRTYKTAFDAGYLVPIYLDEVLPGDTFKLNLTAFARLSTPIVPFMDNIYLDFFFFFVPNRLVWDHWEEFNGYQANPGDSTDYLVPQLKLGNGQSFPVGSVADYFGLPVGVNELSVSALPFRALNLIWNEYFRDENFQDSVEVPTGDGPDPWSTFDEFSAEHLTYPLLKRGKRKDYFTSALPQPQKGPGVEISLAGVAPVINAENNVLNWQDYLVSPFVYDQDGNHIVGKQLGTVANGHLGSSSNSFSGSSAGFSLIADVSNSTAVTINSLRQAFQVQRLLERDNLGGTRYFEILQAHFGVRSPDARLQRPEYLGGGSCPVNIHTVAQTSSTDSTSPQGNLAALGVAGTNQIGFAKSFVEHGYIIGLVCARADLTYQQGIDRHWSRRTRFDFYWPALAHLGEQAIYNREIFAQGNSSDFGVFGYQERWAEYRYGVSKITGKLRSGVAGSLDVWHLAQSFANLPTLNKEFIEENPPIERVLAVQDEPQFIYDSIVSVDCIRPMPVYSVPGLIDHF